MDSATDGASGGDTPTLTAALDQFLQSKRKGQSGNYARQVERVGESFIEFAEKRGAETVGDLDARLLQQYAQHLDRRVASDAIAASTAQNYFSLVRAWLTYCVEWELLDTNPAALARVQDELPDDVDDDTGTERQFWSPEERRQLVAHVDEAAREAIDGDSDPFPAVRDRAVVALLGYSAVRGGEVFRDPNDDRRTGLTWADVHLEDGYITVRGKSQQREAAAVPDQARPALERLRTVVDPPTDDWPVFPSRHAPSLYARVRDRVDDAEARLETDDPLTILRDEGVPPQSITTEGVRSILRRLTDAAGIEPSGPHDYLTPHGARRGVGEVLYRTAGHEAAQRQLRHADPSTTSEMYSHIEAGDQADVASEAFEVNE